MFTACHRLSHRLFVDRMVASELDHYLFIYEDVMPLTLTLALRPIELRLCMEGRLAIDHILAWHQRAQ